MVPAVYHPFWEKCHPNKAFSQKRPWLKTENRLFSPLYQTTPSKSLDCGPTFLVLVGYKLVVLRLLCVCSTTLCYCFLSSPCHFCHCRLVLFCLAACPLYPSLSSMESDVGFSPWAYLAFFCPFLRSSVCLA